MRRPVFLRTLPGAFELLCIWFPGVAAIDFCGLAPVPKKKLTLSVFRQPPAAFHQTFHFPAISWFYFGLSSGSTPDSSP